tara:strand:+ start:168 stop:371 length:204 start_codon:yes stop_codon:yes gene_type:complete
MYYVITDKLLQIIKRGEEVAKKEKQTNEEKLVSLKQQSKEYEVLYQRCQGAIQLLENMIKEENEKTD